MKKFLAPLALAGAIGVSSCASLNTSTLDINAVIAAVDATLTASCANDEANDKASRECEQHQYAFLIMTMAQAAKPQSARPVTMPLTKSSISTVLRFTLDGVRVVAQSRA